MSPTESEYVATNVAYYRRKAGLTQRQLAEMVNATMIGARDIYLYESTDGSYFTCVKHYNYQDYPNMMGSGWSYYRNAVNDYNRVAGRYYYALVYVYAADSTGYDCKPFNTEMH